MSSPGAAERREPEPASPAGSLHGKAEAAVTRLWALMDLMTRQHADPAVLVEILGAGLHFEEMRAELRRFCEEEAARDALVELGRQLERADQADRASRSRPRHVRPARRTYLRPVIAASVAAVTVAGGAGAAVHDDAATAPAVTALAPRPVILRAAAFPPGTAVPVPSPSPSRRALDAHAATPVPSAPASAPVVTASKPPPSPAVSQAPALAVPPSLPLAGTLGVLTLTAGDQAVTWAVDASPGLSASLRGGVLAPGQSVQVRVSDPLGQDGWLYVSFGGTTVPVEVTSGLAAPAMP